MAKLINLTKDIAVLQELKTATSVKDRSRGLIGVKQLMPSEGLWIKRCNWIHTFFMSIPIDVIYLNKKLEVKKVEHNIKPWRLPLPVFAATSVIEVASGVANAKVVEPGDQLHVGD